MSHAIERCKNESQIKDHLRDSELEVIVVVEGFDPMTSQSVQVRTSVCYLSFVPGSASVSVVSCQRARQRVGELVRRCGGAAVRQ